VGDINTLATDIGKMVGATFGEAKVKDARFTDGTRVAI